MKNFFLVALSSATILMTGCTKDDPIRETLESMTLDKAEIELFKGETETLSVEASLEIEKLKLEWSSANEKVASVSQDGVVTAVGTGSTHITATSLAFGKSASCRVTVSQVRIMIEPASVSLEVPGTAELSVLATQGIEPVIEWRSENEEVATVSDKGVITAVGAGATDIVATETVYGATAKCEVTVIDNRPFAVGEGTASNPYILRTSDDLIKLSDFCGGKISPAEDIDLTAAYYELGADIDMAGKTFNAITPFRGHFDGKGHKILNLTVTPQGTAPTALFGVITNAGIKDLRLEKYSVTVTVAEQLYTAGIAGTSENSVIEGCSVSGSIVSGAKTTFAIQGFSSYGNCAVVAGIAAYTKNSEISDCSVSGYISGANQFVGGITAVTDNGSVKKCSVSANTEIVGLMNHLGGITSLLRDNAEISDCKVEAVMKCKYAVNGGICGKLESGIIKNCVVGGNAEVVGHANNTSVSYIGTGGIAGSVMPTAAANMARIENCACYCPVTANLSLGGIVGQVRTNIADNGGVYIINCLYKGHLTAVSKNNYNYGVAGGIVGWGNDGQKDALIITNCAGLVDGIDFLSTATSAGYGGIGGVLWKDAAVTACYSNLDTTDIVSNEQKPIADYPGISQYGSFCGASKYAYITDCYWLASSTMGVNASTTTLTSCEGVSDYNMKDGTLLSKLNAAAAAYNAAASADVQACTWVAGTDGYPVPSTVPSDPAPSTGTAKTRVSIIGDSISTFSGYMPTGYNTFYPTGSVVSASQTYWYKLIYNYMSNAKLDMNIAWTGTLVTRSTDTSCASEHWYGHDFVARFIDKGMGNPDVIIVHGGTNDVSGRGNVSLYPNYAIAGDAYPSDAEFSTCFATADAAKSREAVEALDDTCFVNAYIKLICLIHQQYPNAKVVMLIGDWLPAGARQTIRKIAAHYGELYGYRCVDFQDIAPLHDTKVIPKETGCHPNEKGFEVMARYIYQSAGSYID